MGRKNRNVRTRNLPRAAQRQPKGQRTPSAQSDVRPQRESSGQYGQSPEKWAATPLHSWASDQ